MRRCRSCCRCPAVARRFLNPFILVGLTLVPQTRGVAWGSVTNPSRTLNEAAFSSGLGRSHSRPDRRAIAGAPPPLRASGGNGEESVGAPPPSYVPDRSDATSRLADWLYGPAGCEGEGSTELGSRPSDGRRGVYAREPHGKGEYLFAAPTGSALVIEEDETDDATRGLALLGLMTSERDGRGEGATEDGGGADCGWGAYLDSLPTSDGSNFDSTPDFWSVSDIRTLLEVPRAIDAALARRRRVDDTSEREGVDADELRFATWLVESRAFNILVESEEVGEEEEEEEEFMTTCVLVPYLDMINHSSDSPNAELRVLTSDIEGSVNDNGDDDADVEDFYAVVAIKDIDVGEEVTISYGTGNDSSVDLLLHYGFVPESNVHDTDMIELGGDDLFLEEGQFSTTLEEDRSKLLHATGANMCDMERVALRFRIRMKQALCDRDYT